MNATDFQNIFNRDFYPTPDSITETMVGMSEIQGKIVLEPSFGKENIVKWLKRHGAKRVIGCEINDTLRRAAKECEVIGSDFFMLSSEDVSHIDMIVMNPPFSQQERHIMHAYDIAPPGCEIVSLCNSTMLEGRWRDERAVSHLVNMYGYSEELGDAFSSSEERKTNCNISAVHIFKPGSGDNEFAGFLSFEPDEDNPQGEGIVKYNEIREAVNRYVSAVGMFDGVMEASRKINDVCGELGFSNITFGARRHYDNTSAAITRDAFRKELQKSAWRWVFSKFKMDRYLTGSVYEKLNCAIEKVECIPFTMRNIYRMVDAIVQTHGERMNDVILDAFDIICKYSEENVTWTGEKWKTNSAHMVNRKFIVPYMCTSRYSWNNCVSVDYGGYCTKMDDVVKALCYITGANYDHTSTLYDFVRDMNMEWGREYSWGFFNIRGFKKGTMHFTFQDEDVWYKFNQAVAKLRGWGLPAKTGKRKRNAGVKQCDDITVA